MTLKPGNLANYQILVTGASGFLGRRIVRKLLIDGAYVVGADLVPLPQELEEIGDGALVQRIGDLNSEEFVEKTIEEVEAGGRRASGLFHLSGISHARSCEKNPSMAFQNNAVQTAQLLEACRKMGLTRVLFPSTALVYGNNSARKLTEKHPVNPQTIYASMKLAAEAIIQGYAGSYSLSCDIMRLSNVYGADANPDTAVQTALRQALRGGPIKLQSLKPVRDFIYCEDVAEGFIRVLISGDEPGCRVFNLSSGEGMSIGQIARMVCEIAGIKDEIKELVPSDVSNDSKLILANDKLLERTTWRPSFSISRGLRVAWEEMAGS
jgi:nucleoside-diphosphate-sugar epimerase